MALRLDDIRLHGPALPAPFVDGDLESYLNKSRLLPKAVGAEGKKLEALWRQYQRKLRELVSNAGSIRVFNHVIEPIIESLGFTQFRHAEPIRTREGEEDGGMLLSGAEGANLRIWCHSLGSDLDAPDSRGRAYRFSPVRIAQRVLLAAGERLGIITNGSEIRLLICEAARPDSQIEISLDALWRRDREVPDSFRLFLALANSKGISLLPDILERARQQQSQVTKELRIQSRQAVELFIQEILDNPANSDFLAQHPNKELLAKALWSEGLVVIYRLLFILKLESSDDPARAFSFSSTSLWRNTYSPSGRMAALARSILDEDAVTGDFLESGLRSLFRMFVEGIKSTELVVSPLGGKLFGDSSTPLLSKMTWGERGVAVLLDRLLWTTERRGSTSRTRVHYGSLNVEDLGRVYEALLELEPGIATEPMCRLRRSKLEVVVPFAQGEKYRRTTATADCEDDGDSDEAEDEESSKKSKVLWIEEIPARRFYLRVGLGRKSTGSYYTPHSFVRFLVQETLGPLVAERSPSENPNPGAILTIKVLDPAMGSGHFLVEACRFLGEKLYEACRLCDERALALERKSDETRGHTEREKLQRQAKEFWERVTALPDPDDEMLRYLPSRSPEGEDTGLSSQRALALCRRLVAVHCLYGVDKNPLAVELAKLSLWIESHGEGMPLTFLDHRLCLGDAVVAPLFPALRFRPSRPSEEIEGLFTQGIYTRLENRLQAAMSLIKSLNSNVGMSLSELKAKEAMKLELDTALQPFRDLVRAWTAAAMSPDPRQEEPNFIARAKATIDGRPPDDLVTKTSAFCFDISFPEVFYPDGTLQKRHGFDAILGNPPWEGLDTSNTEFFGGLDFRIFDATASEAKALTTELLKCPEVASRRRDYEEEIAALKRAAKCFYAHVGQSAEQASGATPDLYQLFTERSLQLLNRGGYLGIVLPASVHANEGATGLRRFLLGGNTLLACYSFENRRKLFEIDSRYKFALIVARAGGLTDSFSCKFYLHDDGWLFTEDESKGRSALHYSREFVEGSNPKYLNFLELREAADVALARALYSKRKYSFGELRRLWNINPTEELHRTKNKWRLVEINRELVSSPLRHGESLISKVLKERAFVFYEGKFFHQFTHIWETQPTHAVPLSRLEGKERRVAAARFYRVAFRTVASSTNERSAIFAMLPPFVVCSNSALIEVTPEMRPNWQALALVALANSFCFDWLLRLTVSANITYNFLDAVPVPDLEPIQTLLSHVALILHSTHEEYADLWKEQLGLSDEESVPPRPILSSEERLALRGAIDAAVAFAYGLSREQFEYLLSSFPHSSSPQSLPNCLKAFDDLAKLGTARFVAKYDRLHGYALPPTLPGPSHAQQVEELLSHTPASSAKQLSLLDEGSTNLE